MLNNSLRVSVDPPRDRDHSRSIGRLSFSVRTSMEPEPKRENHRLNRRSDDGLCARSYAGESRGFVGKEAVLLRSAGLVKHGDAPKIIDGPLAVSR